MSTAEVATSMRSAATALLRELDDSQRALAALPFGQDAARRWLEYRPEPRPGACLATLRVPARKAAHKLLATGLSEHAYAQAMAIVALEEVLDRQEQGALNRHSGDYWVSIFGDPDDETWSWRFEGHHLSVTMTLAGEEVSPAPVFLGANPHSVSYAGRVVSRPLAPEEDMARVLLDAMGPAARADAVVATEAPFDIRTSTKARAQQPIEPLGIASGRLDAGPRELLRELAGLYLDRLPAGLANREAARTGELHFAWEGPAGPGTRHYYRIQGDDLLIEYDNTSDDGNHSHTVLRRPRSDFGDDILGAHYLAAHASSRLGTAPTVTAPGQTNAANSTAVTPATKMPS
jgi:hypothetical protein